MPPASDPEMLDLCGEVCPFTFVRTKLRLEQLPTGATLCVLVDHEPARQNIPRSAREWGQKVVSVSQPTKGRWQIVLQKCAPKTERAQRP